MVMAVCVATTDKTGANVARYSGRTLHSRLLDLPEFKEKKWEAALHRAFLKTDEDLRSDPVYANDTSGCTAVAALIVPDANEKGRRIYVANAGDSRCVLGLFGWRGKADELRSQARKC